MNYVEELNNVLEKRIIYHLNSLPNIELIGNSLFDMVKKEKITSEKVSQKEILSMYVRLIESHEKILALSVKLFEVNCTSNILSDEEKELLSVFSKLSNEEKKEIFFTIYRKVNNGK